jgi:putative inorganic carbon (hco3(-)) transporter
MESLVIILFYILFGVLAWKNFKFSLYFVFLLLPTYRVQFEVFNLPFNLLSGIIWILVLVFFLKNIRKVPNLFRDFKSNLKNKENIFASFRWPIILIIISAYLATFFVKDSMGALGLFKSYFLEALFFFVLLVFSLKRKNFKNCIYSLQILVFLIFAVALFQKLSGNFIFNTTDVLEQGRITSLFGYPNANGLILLPIFFLSFINLLKDKKIWLKIFNILTLILSVIVIYWAKSESALVAIIVGLLLFTLFKVVKNKKFILIISLLILLVSLIFPFVIKAPQIIDEPGTMNYTLKQKILLQDLSGQVRRQMWSETIEYLKDYPILGAGLGAYQEKIESYHQTEYIEIFLYPHHIWLNFWVSLGLFGLIGFLCLSILFITKLIKDLSKENLILLIVFLTIIIQGIVEVPYFKNDLAIIWWLVISGYLIYRKTLIKNN